MNAGQYLVDQQEESIFFK